jgi:DNA-binding MarR family transcriptional regulator
MSNTQNSKKGVIQEKWGMALDAGFQVVPNILIRSQNQLNLDPIDLVVLLNLMSHWWEKKDVPFIAPSRIAKRMNVSTRTVERHLKGLEKKGFLRRCKPQRSEEGQYTRGYDLQPLVGALEHATKNALVLRAMQKNQFEGLNPEEHLAATEGPLVQSNGDAEPVHRVASSIPTGEGSGNLGPRVASFKDTPQTPAEQEAEARAMLAIPAKLRDGEWENSLIGKACPVCHALFERGHQCRGFSGDDDDALF